MLDQRSDKKKWNEDGVKGWNSRAQIRISEILESAGKSDWSFEEPRFTFMSSGAREGQFNIQTNKFEGIVRSNASFGFIEGLRINEKFEGLVHVINI